QCGPISERRDQHDKAVPREEPGQDPCDVAERPLSSRPHVGQVIQDPVQLLPPERGRDPVEDVPLYDQADAVLRREHVVRDPERGPHAMFDRVLRLRADERLAPRVDDDDDVAGAFPLVLVREEPVEAGGGFPVDAAYLVTGDVLADAPEIRPGADLAGHDLTKPRAGAPRAEPRAAEVLHRRGDDEARVEADDRVFGAERQWIEGPPA